MKKEKKIDKKLYIIMAIIIICIILLDQITKFVAININYADIIPNFLNFHIAENNSGTYGIGSGSVFSYILTNLIVIVVLAKFITSQNEFIDTKIRIFLTLIIGGGISNVIDKIFRGYVIEFIDFNLLPVINIADIFIFLGWICFIATFITFAISEIRNNKAKRNVNFDDKDKDKIKAKKDKDEEKQ